MQQLERLLATLDNPRAGGGRVLRVVPLGGATHFGGHKGYGLSLASWILTSLLSGAWRTDAARDRVLGAIPEPKYGFAQEGIGHCFAAIRLDQFGDPELFRQGMDAMIQAMNDSPPAEDFAKVLVPGQDSEARRFRTLGSNPSNFRPSSWAKRSSAA